MATTDIKKQLARIEKMLQPLAGVQKTTMVTPEQFLDYVQKEIAKAMQEPQEKSALRLALLQKAVLYSSAIIEDDESDGVKVPIFVAEQSTLDEQDNQLFTPEKLASLNPSDGTFFENSISKGLEQVRALHAEIEALAKDTTGDLPEDDDAEKKKKAAAKAADDEAPPDSEDEATKAAKAKAPPPPPPGAPPGAKKPPFPPKPPQPPAAAGAPPAEKTKKGASAEWPDDMNDPSFVETGKKAPLDWGNDKNES